MSRAGDLIGLHGVRVLAEQCPTCVFRPGNPMYLEPGALHEIVATNRAGGTWLTCHKTLPEVAGYGAAACRGWEIAYGLGPVVNDLIHWFGREDVEP